MFEKEIHCPERNGRDEVAAQSHTSQQERGLGLQAETKLDPSYSLIAISYGVSVLCISIPISSLGGTLQP